MNLSHQLNLQGHMMLDDISTWPADLVKSLENNRQVLVDYSNEHSRLRKQAAQEVENHFHKFGIRRRIQLAPNKYEAKRQSALIQISEALEGVRAVGFHCTRLLDYEAVEIKETGLQPISDDLVLARVDRALSEGHISKEDKKQILKHHRANHELHTEQAWLFCSRPLNYNTDDVRNFFTYWGGDVLQTASSKLGEPCIVIGSVQASVFGIVRSTDWYLKHRGLADIDEEQEEFKSWSNVPVLHVVKHSDKKFKCLAGKAIWADCA